jgi:hypothetical protein
VIGLTRKTELADLSKHLLAFSRLAHQHCRINPEFTLKTRVLIASVEVHDAHAMDDEKYSSGDQYCEQERHDSVHEFVRGACAKDGYVADFGPRECDSAVGRSIELILRAHQERQREEGKLNEKSEIWSR